MIPTPVIDKNFDQLQVSVYQSNIELGLAAAYLADVIIKKAIQEKGSANVVLAAANSQLTFYAGLKKLTDIDWSKVNFFHMDEYIGLKPGHPASFSQFLRTEIVDFLKPKAFFTISTQGTDLEKICSDYAKLLKEYPTDLCAMGIGENGHVAFNDPPYADFNDPKWVKSVEIDNISRQQQVNEGHFGRIEDVPIHAVTLTVPALLSAHSVLVMVPESRKANAVYKSLYGPIVDTCPASILRNFAKARLLLDRDSAAKSFTL
jgi:glucosamine-6-phosphate deaminase